VLGPACVMRVTNWSEFIWVSALRQGSSLLQSLKAFFVFDSRRFDAALKLAQWRIEIPAKGVHVLISCVPIVCQHSDTAAHLGAEDGSESPIITKAKLRQSTVAY